MAGPNEPPNPLVLKGNAPEALPPVQLHPLVLLTISDYITRHTLRSQTGPIVGAVIGQQIGRTYSLEFAYECRVIEEQDQVLVDAEWFNERLEAYREVHKEPALDLVALFVLGPIDGPQPAHLPVVKQVQALTGADGVLLLIFHSQLVEQLSGGNLPISLYEPVIEYENEQSQTKFRELGFEVDSGDAEMIGVDFVAKGGGNAGAVTRASTNALDTNRDKKSKNKGKSKEKDSEGSTSTEASMVLSTEDEELIASLAGKANAIKMLNQRLHVIQEYLASLPPSSLTDASLSNPPSKDANHPLLRSINSMLSRLPLLSPPTSNDGESPALTARDREKQDVHMTALLSALTRSIADARALANKYQIVQREKSNRDRSGFARPPHPRQPFGIDDDGGRGLAERIGGR